MGRTINLIVSGEPFLAPRPPSHIEEYAKWARLFGIPFQARTPHQLEESLRRVKSRILLKEPDDGRPADE